MGMHIQLMILEALWARHWTSTQIAWHTLSRLEQDRSRPPSLIFLCKRLLIKGIRKVVIFQTGWSIFLKAKTLTNSTRSKDCPTLKYRPYLNNSEQPNPKCKFSRFWKFLYRKLVNAYSHLTSILFFMLTSRSFCTVLSWHDFRSLGNILRPF